jgi:two-component system, OmpR family, sensor kinase
MSAVTPTPAARRRLVPPSRWSLRARLLLTTVALLAGVSLVVGAVAVLALERGLSARLDDQLLAAADRSARGLADGGPSRGPDSGRPFHEAGRGGPGAPLRVPGQGEGTLGVLVEDGEVVSSLVVTRTGQVSAVPGVAAARLVDVAPGAAPRTVDLDGDLGAYRVVAVAAPGGATFVTGLPLDLVRGPVSDVAVVVLAVGLLGVVLAAGAGWVVLARTLAPLRRVAQTATRVAEMPLDRGEVALAERVPAVDTDPRTEVGQVGAALNHLLENVAAALATRHGSETRVRRFVADASHELRTPLASIRGYAELARRSPEVVPEPVSHALSRVESEAVRMSALVDDLLLLARLDEGRPVAHAPVDLSALVIDSVSDAHAAGPGHRWDLTLPDEPVVVDGDGERLRQVLANLLSNARVHTPAGTEVQVGLSAVGGTAVLRVSDEGPGIPADLQPVAFERFARGDASRSRATGSTGLGLAIVAAVVAAHGGTVRLSSVPGRTTVTVQLPLTGGRAGR